MMYPTVFQMSEKKKKKENKVFQNQSGTYSGLGLRIEILTRPNPL